MPLDERGNGNTLSNLLDPNCEGWSHQVVRSNPDELYPERRRAGGRLDRRLLDIAASSRREVGTNKTERARSLAHGHERGDVQSAEAGKSMCPAWKAR